MNTYGWTLSSPLLSSPLLPLSPPLLSSPLLLFSHPLLSSPLSSPSILLSSYSYVTLSSTTIYITISLSSYQSFTFYITINLYITLYMSHSLG